MRVFISSLVAKMDLYHVDEAPQLICWDRKYFNTFEDNLLALKVSAPLLCDAASLRSLPFSFAPCFSRNLTFVTIDRGEGA